MEMEVDTNAGMTLVSKDEWVKMGNQSSRKHAAKDLH